MRSLSSHGWIELNASKKAGSISETKIVIPQIQAPKASNSEARGALAPAFTKQKPFADTIKISHGEAKLRSGFPIFLLYHILCFLSRILYEQVLV